MEYGSNETIQWITKGDTVPIADNELATMAYENWKHVSVSLIRWMPDEQQNRGKAKIIDLMKLKLGAAERSLNEEFERVMFADGTGVKEPNGLQNIVSAAPTTGTLHGINRATAGNEYFRNQQKTASGAASLYLVSDMRTCMNDIMAYSRAEIRDITIVTTQAVFELYEEEGYEIYQLNNNALFDAGFDTLRYRGRPVIWCPSAPSGNMYFINAAYLSLVCDEEWWMLMTDWKTIPNQPHDRVAQITCTCNMVCNRPIVQKVLTGISA